MPIGSTVVYNSGDLILSTVSSSGNTFQENKIAAATSSIILFNSNALISSQSLISTTVGTASYVSGSSSIITNLTASNISASGTISASLFVGSHSGSTFGTSSWSTNALTASSISSTSNAFVQGGNSFGTTALLGTNDAQPLALETNGTTRMSINSNGNVAINTSTSPSVRLSISDTHQGSLGSSSLYIDTIQNQNQGLATSANDSGINNAYFVNNFTSSTAIQNQAIFNNLYINGSGSFSGSYRSARNAITLSNTASLNSDGIIINTYLTNQISPNIPTFSIPNWIAGTQTYVDLVTGNTTGSITNLYHHQITSPFNVGAGGITVTNSYGIYINKQKTTNVVTNGWGIYQVDTGDLNIFAGKTRIGSTTVPVNALDVTGNISASAYTGSSAIITNITASNISASGTSSFGYVGIGTTNPASNLSVIGEIYASSRVISDRYASVTNGNNNSILFSSNTTSFINNGGTSLYINSSGGVGIGTTSPVNRLDVAGNISCNVISSSNSYCSNIGFTDQTVAPDTSIFPTGSTAGGLILDGGVYTNGFYRTRFVKVDRGANLSLYIQETKGTSGSFSNLARFGTHTNSPNTFEVFGTTNIQGAITSSNFVGPLIGNTTGTASWSTNALTASSLVVANSYTITNLTASNVSASNTGSFNIVGIGVTNPSQKLEVQGNGQFGNDSVTSVGLKLTRLIGGIRTSEHSFHSTNNNPWYTYGQNLNWTGELAGTVESTQAFRPYFEGFSPAVGYKVFGFMDVTTGTFTSANVVNSLVIRNTGNVGIGTTNPVNRLDVVGNISCSVITASNFFGTSSWASNALTASFLPVGTYNITSSFATTASFALNAGGTTLTTGSTYPITSSWANNALTASYLVPTNNYQVTNLTASNISASGTIRATNLIETSTIAAKYNIFPLENQLDKISKLNPVSFNYKLNDQPSIGLIAEEVGKIYPEFTSETNDAIAYGKMVSVLIQSVKELKTIVENQQQQINNLLNK